MSDLYRYTEEELSNIMDDLTVVLKRILLTYEAQAFLLGEIIAIRREVGKRKQPKDAA